MKNYLLKISLFFTLIGFSQNQQLAQDYFDKGDFEKAKLSYEALVKTQPGNSFNIQRLIDCYQQLKEFEAAEALITNQYNRFKQSFYFVELGYNFQLQKEDAKAKKNYEAALEKIKQKPNEVYGIAATFERKTLLEYAIKSYEIAVTTDSKLNFDYQIALLYGQLGKMDLMIDKLLTEAYNNPLNSILIQNQLSRFMTETPDAEFNELLKKELLIRAQKNQDVFWNEYLSWFYVQQKEYGKAFIQEKAIYKRTGDTLSNIINLAQLAIQDSDTETAVEILNYVIENTKDIELLVQAHTYLLKIRIDSAKEKDFNSIASDIELRLKEFGISPYSLSLQILQAQFLTFKLNNPEQAKSVLKRALALPLSNHDSAQIKMELADVLLYEEKFNQALIYYSQIEEDLKNDVIGHEASLKSAKTSYFKGDFKWALKQFKELKSATSQLIANDALEYFLLISDNTAADSTLTALKQFSRADYLLFQNKNQAALSSYLSILKDFKGNEIEAVTYLRIGKLYEKLGDFNLALSQYQIIINQFNEGIYIDEAYYYSAEIYNIHLKDTEKAKANYEKIIFNHQDSIYFTDSRKKYRQLRGDTEI
ncbi:MAG TPA: tetratricopeptide repeat protein [Flavobacterium sp.]|nr:tetratricopeptide repeat protein [Flavobacterium sp.]